MDNNWSGVPGIVGYRGDALTGATAVDPQTVLADGSATPRRRDREPDEPEHVHDRRCRRVRHHEPRRRAPGLRNRARAAPRLHARHDRPRDRHGRLQPARRRRLGRQRRPAGRAPVPRRHERHRTRTSRPASSPTRRPGPSLATLVTPVSAPLPAAAENQPLVQVRVITTDAVGSDEWVGVDDISVTGRPPATRRRRSVDVAGRRRDRRGPSNANITIHVQRAGERHRTRGSRSPARQSARTPADVSAAGRRPSRSTRRSTFAANETCTVTVVGGGRERPGHDRPAGHHGGRTTSSASRRLAPPVPGAVVVSEVYGGGGNAGATYTNDFIELYNRDRARGQPGRLVGAVRLGDRHDLAGHAAHRLDPGRAATTSSRRPPARAARPPLPRPRRHRHDRDVAGRPARSRSSRARPRSRAPARPAARSSTSSATATANCFETAADADADEHDRRRSARAAAPQDTEQQHRRLRRSARRIRTAAATRRRA